VETDEGRVWAKEALSMSKKYAAGIYWIVNSMPQDAGPEVTHADNLFCVCRRRI
jgi:hypothetical protein